MKAIHWAPGLILGLLLLNPSFSHEHSADQFTQSVELVKRLYVDQISDDQLFEGAVKGMLENLDPHSTYLNPKAYRELKQMSSGSFVGVGLEVILKKNEISVVTPIDDSPAEKAGLLPEDVILQIDQQSTMGMSLEESIEKMRGKAGSSVDLTVYREGQDRPLTFHLIRAPLQVNPVKGQILDQTYAYLRISNFQEETGKTLDRLIQQLTKQTPHQKLSGVILDLRNNPGGLLEEATAVSDIFLDVNTAPYHKVIVTTKGRNESVQQVATVKTPDHLKGTPLVVLINHGTASAAEIVAAALQDDNRAILVGTQSFGKGSVQTIIPLLEGDAAVKLTTSRYYTPKGTPIQAVGVKPDVEVEQVSVSGVKSQNPFLQREALLKGHLKAENANPENSGDDHDYSLAKKDFQLYQALMILKGMVSLES